MKHILTFTGSYWAAVLVVVIGLSAYGCKDSVSVSEDVEVPLSSLTVTPGTLQPAFSSNTTSYIVDVSTTVTSVTVTATPQASTTTMTINGVDTNPGQGRTIPLSPSGTSTSITIVLTNQNGTESAYNIVVRKVDNTLSALTVTPPGTFPPPGFTPSTLDYQVDVDSGVSSVTVSATKLDPRSVMSGAVNARAGVATGKATIPLNGPGTDTLVSITVAVPNSEAKTYTITVHRAALSSNNKLKDLIAALSILDPNLINNFNENATSYTVNVANTVTSVIVTATKSDLNAVMLIGSITVPAGTASGQETFPLDGPGTQTVVSISVTAQSGGAPNIYTITVNRAASSDNTLSALTVTANNAVQPLAPDFNANILDYTVNVANSVDKVTVAATKSDLNAVMLIGSITVPAGTASGQETFPLDGPGTQTVVSISVTAQSGGAPNTYTITVNRAAPSSDNNLSALTVTGGPLVPDFAPSTTIYSVDVPNSVASVIVSATKSDPNAVMSGSVTAGTGQATGQAIIDLPIPLLPTLVSITVMAPNGDSKTYTITITRALF